MIFFNPFSQPLRIYIPQFLIWSNWSHWMILLTYAENELHRKIASVPEHFFLCIWSFTKSWFLSNQKCIKFTHSLTFNRTFLLLKFLFYNLVFEVCCNIVFIFFCEGSQLCDGNHATKAQRKRRKHHNYTYKHNKIRSQNRKRVFSKTVHWLIIKD